jgi:hypothetical protein
MATGSEFDPAGFACDSGCSSRYSGVSDGSDLAQWQTGIVPFYYTEVNNVVNTNIFSLGATMLVVIGLNGVLVCDKFS